MRNTLLPNDDNKELGSLEVEVNSENGRKTNDIDDIIIPKNNRKNLKKKKIIIFLIIIIMAIISGIVIIYFFFIYKPRKSTCELGVDEKCKTCDQYNYCDSCNPGYKLENGACIINYSFKTLYQTQKENQRVNLLGEFKFIIEEMIIDGKKVDPCRKYIFESIGLHSVYVLVDLSQTSSLESMFYESDMISISFSEKFNTEKIVDMNYMFDTCQNLTSIDLSVFNTRNVLDMGGMFSECTSLISVDLSNFNTEHVEDMNSFFYKCNSLTSIDLSNFNTENVKDMAEFFNECNSLTSINLSNFNTKNVKDMNCMFQNCISLNFIDLSGFETSKVEDMDEMFSNWYHWIYQILIQRKLKE